MIFFSSRRRHTICARDWSSDVCSSDLTRLTRYQEGLRDETIRRQKTDLLTFARFLVSINIQAGDFYNDLSAWQGRSEERRVGIDVKYKLARDTFYYDIV